MKGSFLVSSKNFQLELKGERWRQGEMLQGSALWEGNSPLSLSLALGQIKKVLKGDPKAFKILYPLCTLENSQASFKFQLPTSCPISDTTSAPYIVLQGLPSIFPTLQLPVVLDERAERIIQLWEQFFRFKIHSIKNSKTGIVIEMKAPQSKELGHVRSLSLDLLQTDHDHWPLQVEFGLEKLHYEAGNVSAKKSLFTTKAELHLKELFPQPSMPSQEKILAVFEALLVQVKAQRGI